MKREEIVELEKLNNRRKVAMEEFTYHDLSVTFRVFDIEDLARKIYSNNIHLSKDECYALSFKWYGYEYDDLARKMVKIDENSTGKL